MGKKAGGLLILLCLVMAAAAPAADGQMVPAVFLFGDSAMDSGNNNDRVTLFKADFLPYGRDFPGHTPTGRFCNGKLASDFTVDTLGFDGYPPAYLKPNATDKSLLIGANFASGGSGYLNTTALLSGAVSLDQQLSNYKEYQGKVEKITGNKTKSDAMFSGGIHLLSGGTSDFLQNYYLNPLYNLVYTPQQFADLLIDSFNSFIENLYDLGARKIGVISLPPIGCMPAAITLYGSGSNDCVEKMNTAAQDYNKKLNVAAGKLLTKLKGLNLVVFDTYTTLKDLIDNPAKNGFFEARKACCGTGLLEVSLLCNAKSPGTCDNATGYVFWDSFHPTESANQVVANALLAQGIGLITG